MELTTLFSELNYLAILVAATIQLVLGYLWYSPFMFAGSWMRENGLSESKLKQGMPFQTTLAMSFILFFIESIVLAILLSSSSDLASAINWSVLIGIGFLGAFTGIHYLYERRSLRLFLINASYNVFALILASIVLALWK